MIEKTFYYENNKKFFCMIGNPNKFFQLGNTKQNKYFIFLKKIPYVDFFNIPKVNRYKAYCNIKLK